MEDFLPSYAVGAFLNGLTQLIILIGCIILILKQKNLANLLLLLGIILMFMLSIAGIIWPITVKGSPEDLLSIQGTLAVLRGIAYLIFGIGFLLLAINNLRKKAQHL